MKYCGSVCSYPQYFTSYVLEIKKKMLETLPQKESLFPHESAFASFFTCHAHFRHYLQLETDTTLIITQHNDNDLTLPTVSKWGGFVLQEQGTFYILLVKVKQDIQSFASKLSDKKKMTILILLIIFYKRKSVQRT